MSSKGTKRPSPSTTPPKKIAPTKGKKTSPPLPTPPQPTSPKTPPQESEKKQKVSPFPDHLRLPKTLYEEKLSLKPLDTHLLYRKDASAEEILTLFKQTLLSRYNDYQRRKEAKTSPKIDSFWVDQIRHWCILHATEPLLKSFSIRTHWPSLHKWINECKSAIDTWKDLHPLVSKVGAKRFDFLTHLKWDSTDSFTLEYTLWPTEVSYDDCEDSGDRDDYYGWCNKLCHIALKHIAARVYPGTEIEEPHPRVLDPNGQQNKVFYKKKLVMYSEPGTDKSFLTVHVPKLATPTKVLRS